jgi:sigma-B regulation protein RsbU (phosphoserine phosphatase)
MVDERDQLRVQRYVDRVLSGNTPGPIEHRIVHKNGSRRWIRNTIVPQFDAEGQLVHYDGIVEDITQRKRAEMTLRRRRVQLLAAQRIQQRLLPQVPPSLDGYRIAAAVFPAEFVAGDLYDFIPMVDGNLAVVIGDVAGHGFGPAIFMALTHATLRTLATLSTDVAEILNRANAALAKQAAEERFVTLFFGRLEPTTGRLTYVGAGHPRGVLLDAAGEPKCCLSSRSLPLGVLPETHFALSEPVMLEQGDTLLLLTDGLLEARNRCREMFGLERVLRVVKAHRLKSPSDIIHQLHREVMAFRQVKKLADDVTILLVRRTVGGTAV